jgi:hypothetical protein
VRPQRQHQQGVEAEPLEQRRLGRIGAGVGAPDDPRLAAVDHLLRQRVVGHEEELERMRLAAAPVAGKLDEQVSDHARHRRERRVEELDELGARDLKHARHRFLGFDALQDRLDVRRGHSCSMRRGGGSQASDCSREQPNAR